MDFDEKAWKEQLSKAKTNEEFHAAIMALPVRGPAITEEEQRFFTMERRQTSNSSIRTIPDEKILGG